MNFGEALEELKKGRAVAREGWNGKGMSVIYVPEKIEFGTKYNPFFQIKNVNESISTWVPSINDCLAEDWYTADTETGVEDKTPEYILRMMTEDENLKNMIEKAQNFFNKEFSKPEKTDEKQRMMLNMQIHHMLQYEFILHQRIKCELDKII